MAARASTVPLLEGIPEGDPHVPIKGDDLSVQGHSLALQVSPESCLLAGGKRVYHEIQRACCGGKYMARSPAPSPTSNLLEWVSLVAMAT